MAKENVGWFIACMFMLLIVSSWFCYYFGRESGWLQGWRERGRWEESYEKNSRSNLHLREIRK